MSEHFCTYFDHRYAPKGLAMWRSLKARHAGAILHVLCLNEACREILAPLELDDVHLHSLSALEAAYPGLLQARGNRRLVEYYFTVTPCLPLYLLETHPDVTRITYVDADLFFFADPQPVFDEMGGDAVGVIEHRFPDELAGLVKHGRFNVGWVTFRNDPVGLACLAEWRDQCFEWCYDKVEPGRFAEQKYLDEWPERFPRVRIIQHKGANVAPWNLGRFALAKHGGQLTVGGEPILFFHAHGFQPASPGRGRELNLQPYRVEETPLLQSAIFDPYEEALARATTSIARPLAQALLADESRRKAQAQLDSAQAQLAAALAQLADSERDRAARLEVIKTLEEELRRSAADGAARMDVIETLQVQLAASGADGAARLDVIHAMQRELAASVADGEARLELIYARQKELDASRAEQAAQLEAVRGLEESLRDSEARRAALSSQLADSEADRAARIDALNAARTEVESMTRDLDLTRQQLAAERARIVAMESTRSWRLTRALRMVANLLGLSRPQQ